MRISTTYAALGLIALSEFMAVVVHAQIVTLPTGDPLKLRLGSADGSLLDVFVSAGGRYSHHWERRVASRDDLYRHDNGPFDRWRHVATFPKHVHDGSEGNVVASSLADEPEQAVRAVLNFVHRKLLSER